jgi:hypothetical protein
MTKKANDEYYYYISQYVKLYEKRYGNIELSPTLSRKDKIGKLIKEVNGKKLLDYGCGSGDQYSKLSLDKEWGIEKVFCYDPAIEKYSNKPDYNIGVDVVICVDVMEHIPESSVGYVLEDIFKFNSKLVIFNISYVLASNILPNGENAHITVKDSAWWYNKIEQHNINNIEWKDIRNVKNINEK